MAETGTAKKFIIRVDGPTSNPRFVVVVAADSQVALSKALALMEYKGVSAVTVLGLVAEEIA